MTRTKLWTAPEVDGERFAGDGYAADWYTKAGTRHVLRLLFPARVTSAASSKRMHPVSKWAELGEVVVQVTSFGRWSRSSAWSWVRQLATLR